MKPLSYDACWAEVSAMGKADMSLLMVLAGVFLLLPGFAQALWAPGPELKSLDLDGLKQLNEYFVENWPVLLACQLPVWLGTGAIYALMLDRARPTVAEALKAAVSLIPAIMLVDWLSNLALIIGFAAFIVPGVYLLGRLATAAPAQMAERLANPLTALERSFALTRDNGWRTAGLVILVAVVAGVAGAAMTAVLGAAISALADNSLAETLIALLRATLGAAMSLLMLLVTAAIYRQLSSMQQAAAGS